MSNKLLEVKNLKTNYLTEKGKVKAVDDISFYIKENESFGLMGESGCGKSTVALSILKLLPPEGIISGGNIHFNGTDLVRLPTKKMRKYRGAEITMIFQDPSASLNPVFTVGNQIVEAIKLHRELKGKKAWEEAGEILTEVGIPSANERVKDYPHEFSGGMRQRTMIALALSCHPSLIICDEPTTNLDVTTQAKILRLINKLQNRLKMSILYITHDLGVIAQLSDRVGAMYAGHLVEVGGVREVFKHPKHPYTEGLLKGIPDPRYERKELKPIPGKVPELIDPPSGCQFHPRCNYATEECKKSFPKEERVSETHSVSCYHPING